MVKERVIKPGAKIKFSLRHLLIFAAIFGIIGGYFIWQSFAATSSVGDIDGSGTVDLTDLSLLLSSFGQSTTECLTNNSYTCDINTNGTSAGKIDIFDLSLLLSNYGKVVSDMGATGYRQLVQPSFNPTSKVTATTPTEFTNDLVNLQPGEELDVQPMTLSGSFNVNKALSSYAEIHFAPGVVFSGATTRAFYTISIQNASNIRIYGGELENAMGGCVRVADSTNVLWWHFKFHDCAAGGILGTSLNTNSTGLDFDGEIYHVAYDTSFDPHAEKCTGIHGAYIGATYQNDTVAMSGKFSLYLHDIPCGGAFQAGSNLFNSEIWVKAESVTYQAQSQTAGNAIQFWGGALNNITVHKVTGNNLAGRVVETSGMYATGNSNIVVESGSGTNTLQNPLLSRINYGTDPTITYPPNTAGHAATAGGCCSPAP